MSINCEDIEKEEESLNIANINLSFLVRFNETR